MFVHSECTRRYMYSNIIMMIGSLKRALRERILGLMQEKKIAIVNCTKINSPRAPFSELPTHTHILGRLNM